MKQFLNIMYFAAILGAISLGISAGIGLIFVVMGLGFVMIVIGILTRTCQGKPIITRWTVFDDDNSCGYDYCDNVVDKDIGRGHFCRACALDDEVSIKEYEEEQRMKNLIKIN